LSESFSALSKGQGQFDFSFFDTSSTSVLKKHRSNRLIGRTYQVEEAVNLQLKLRQMTP